MIIVWCRRPNFGAYKHPLKIGSGLSSIQDLCIGMHNYIMAGVNNHNEITDTEESNHSSNDLVILLTYFLWEIDV